IGLFGGSFNPPHHGHRCLVERALQQLNLDALWVVPVGLAVHRTLSTISPQQRLHLVTTMFADIPKVTVLDWEVNADVAIPSSQTLARFRHLNPYIVPLFILGMDAWASMESWLDYPIHRKLCNVAVFSRVGVAPHTLSGWKNCELTAWQQGEWQGAGHVVFVPGTLPDISATALRQALRVGDSSLIQQSAAIKKTLQQWYGYGDNNIDE
ncbi:MAG: nicotinate-nicotinamide nucleotide adenylyltransferase, partial [Mariprofundaceae bacterium]|nr:nicotinate-nicotinamide nucleotide adenylyltransferase [Mariprofundaceae bacterium]